MKNLIILFLLFNSFSLAQIMDIRGRVIDAETGNPLPGANIYLEENPVIGVSTDSLGNFRFRHIFKKSDYLVISYIGYYKKTRTGNYSCTNGIGRG